MRPPTRSLSLSLALVTLLASACGDDGGGAADTFDDADAVEVAPPAEQPVTLALAGELTDGPTHTYDVGGTAYDLTLEHVYVVAGNVTFLAPGDPVPGFAPALADPLQVGARAVEGYRVVDLMSGADFGPVELPQGWAGPIYFAMLNADDGTDPLQGVDAVPGIAGAMLLLEGSIVVGTLEKAIQFKLSADQLVAVGGPAFSTTQPRTVRVSVDLDDWFAEMDVSALTHTTNTIYINDGENAAAFATVAARALAALDAASVSVE